MEFGRVCSHEGMEVQFGIDGGENVDSGEGGKPWLKLLMGQILVGWDGRRRGRRVRRKTKQTCRTVQSIRVSIISSHHANIKPTSNGIFWKTGPDDGHCRPADPTSIVRLRVACHKQPGHCNWQGHIQQNNTGSPTKLSSEATQPLLQIASTRQPYRGSPGVTYSTRKQGIFGRSEYL